MHFADIVRCVAFCINGFLMTQRQMTFKDICEYIILENFSRHVQCMSDAFLQLIWFDYTAESQMLYNKPSCTTSAILRCSAVHDQFASLDRYFRSWRAVSLHKDDSAMRPIWVPWTFTGVPDYAHGYFSRHFRWAYLPIDAVNMRTKFELVALPVPGIIGGTQHKKLDSPWIRPRFLFSEIFNELLFGWTLWIYRPNLKSLGLPVREIMAIVVFGGGYETQSWGRWGYRGSGIVPFERALMSTYRPSIVTVPPSLRVVSLSRFCVPARHLFPPNL